MAVVEIVATRIVFASCGSSMAAGKIEQLVEMAVADSGLDMKCECPVCNSLSKLVKNE